jgi:hypothetical protein
MNWEEKNPSLFYFLSGQFNNMWPEMYGIWENAVDEYMARLKVATIERIREGLHIILSEDTNEETLEKIVTEELKANFYAPGDGTTYQAWLEKVYEMAGEWIKKKKEEQS